MSSTSTSPSSSISSPFQHGDYYYVMLLNAAEQQTTVLMSHSDGVWDLPYFEYPEKSLDGTLIPFVCEDFKSWLEIKNDHVYFTGAVELLGNLCHESKKTPEVLGRLQLLLVEIHGMRAADIYLPEGSEWKGAPIIPGSLPDPQELVFKKIRERILQCLEKPSSFLYSLSDERYRPKWFANASRFLVESATRDCSEIQSRVVQRHMSSSSTMLQVQTSSGDYFLKSPASGCRETTITVLVAKLFPKVCPSIVGASEELNCFVSRGFDHTEPEDTKDAVLALGQLQLRSMDHIESLMEAGCAVRNIDEVAERSKEWPQRFRDLNCNTAWLMEALPRIEKLSTELKGFNIPMTLVHGDFNFGNIGFAERDGRRDLVMFDWEYAYIGHPFFDFHRIHKQVPESVREEYLKLWSSYEDMDRARRALKIAKRFGWVMKLWSALECAEKCNAQGEPCLATNTCLLSINSLYQLNHLDD